MATPWIPLVFETCERGVSSAVAPELLPDNQDAWGMNIDVRGGKAATRPNLRNRVTLPPGLIQGCEYFSVQNGMLVASISGRLYKIRVNGNSFLVEEIALGFENNPILKQAWMTQTVETLVIQDGQSNAILYDGSTAERAVYPQVPRGRQMAYLNGRLWVAVNANEVVAGDIRTGVPGSELRFTETDYLNGGGKLFFPRDITGLAGIPVTGQADYGALLVFGAGETNAIRADITSRDDWGKIPGFVTCILRSVGASCQWSIVSVNQDLYWRDSNGGIRSIRNALADEAGPGSSPISREVSRLTDYDSNPQLAFCSGVYFDNRLLMTSSPFLMKNGGVGFRDLISLDYAPLSTMDGKSQPAYNGKWNGLNFVKLVGGEFAGKNRAFALTTDDNGNNELWEFGTGARSDIVMICESDGTSDGTSDVETTLEENPITCFVEYPLRNFGNNKQRKLLKRCDVWLSGVDGDVELTVYWRADNSKKWLRWDADSTCAQTTDPATSTPHVWKNLVAQERPQFKTFTIPDDVNDVVKYAARVGFEFQIRLVWTGRCRIHRMMLYAGLLSDPAFADRAGFANECVQDDVSSNQIAYRIPTGGCPSFVLTQDGVNVFDWTDGGRRAFGLGGPLSPHVYPFVFCNEGENTIYSFNVSILTLCPDGFNLVPSIEDVILPGECITFELHYDPFYVAQCDVPSALISLEIGGIPFAQFTVDDETHPERPSIQTQPTPQNVEPGGEAQFTVVAYPNSLPIVYRWQVSGDGGSSWNDVEDDDTNYGGATTATLTIEDVPEGFDGNLYRVRVRNEVGQVFSDEVALTVGGGFFRIPLASLGDVRAFTDAADYCPFIGGNPSIPGSSCGSYLFENTHTPDEINGWNQSFGPGPGDVYTYVNNYQAIKSSGAITGPISGKLAGAFEIPSTSNVPIDSLLAGACSFCAHNITLKIYDESGALVLTDSATDFLDNTTLSVNPSLPAGKYLVVMEYEIAGNVSDGWGASFSIAFSTIGAPPTPPISIAAPQIFDQTSVHDCGSIC